MSSSNARSDPKSTYLSHLDLSDLKSLKVAIRRSNIPPPKTPQPLLRSLDEPSQLIIHYRPDEGLRPIFDRDDIRVNQRHIREERVILSSPNRATLSRSTSRSRSPQTESQLKKDREYHHKSEGHRQRTKSPGPSRRKTVSPPYRNKDGERPSTSKYRRHSRSPPKYDHHKRGRSRSFSPRRTGRPPDHRDKSPQNYKEKKRRNSRSPPARDERRRYSRSPPHKYRPSLPDRKRSRTPTLPKRSRTRSPPHRRRSRSKERRHSSRSPHHRSSSDYRIYDRSRNSRSPRRVYRRYSPERRSRASRSPKRDKRPYEPPMVPEIQYFEGDEFWIPTPRFLPRGFIPPPGAFPRGMPAPVLIPRIPIMVPPHPVFRPRFPIYNSKLLRKPTPMTASTTGTTTATASTSTAVVSTSVGNNPSVAADVITTTAIVSDNIEETGEDGGVRISPHSNVGD